MLRFIMQRALHRASICCDAIRCVLRGTTCCTLVARWLPIGTGSVQNCEGVHLFWGVHGIQMRVEVEPVPDGCDHVMRRFSRAIWLNE
jgi:hypothetical protein